MWGQMQTAVFHGIAYTCCTASFQSFCGMSAIRYNVLSDRAFPQVCYRTLVECKGSGFLGISVVCTEILHENIWLAWINVVIHDLFVWKVFSFGRYSLEKVQQIWIIRLEKCRTIALYLFLALVLTSQSSLNYTLSDIIAVVKQ